MKTAQKLIYLNTNVKSSNTLKGMLVQKEVKLILVCKTLVLVGVDTGVAALGAAPEKHIEPGQVGQVPLTKYLGLDTGGRPFCKRLLTSPTYVSQPFLTF